MFCILKIGCRCAFEIAKEAERDEIGLAGKQQFAEQARRQMAARRLCQAVGVGGGQAAAAVGAAHKENCYGRPTPKYHCERTVFDDVTHLDQFR